MDKRTKAVAKLIKATRRQTSVGDFQYVVQRPGKSRICFGTGIDRAELRPVSRHNIQYTACPILNLSPGMYHTAQDPNISKPISNKGTVLGGRTAPRYPSPRPADTPPPGAYNIPDTLQTPTFTFKGATRFKKDPKFAVVGPGYYKTSASHRTMAYAYSFGGKRRLIPAIEMKCGPFNLDTCQRCKKSPNGDYWQLTIPNLTSEQDGEEDTCYLCRTCHEKESMKPKLFTQRQLKQFKKVRDCSKIHFHDGCDARLLLLPPRDIEKIQEKEAYLSLYFP